MQRSWVRELVRQFVQSWRCAGQCRRAPRQLSPSGNGTLAITIIAVILLNAVLAYAQELQAERATEALQELLPPHARVRRDAVEMEIPAALLVPGDVVLLAEGDRLSADARLTDGSVELDMAALTGESQPVVRSAAAVRRAASVLEAEDLSRCSGTLLYWRAARARSVIYATRNGARLGRIRRPVTNVIQT